MKVSVKRLVRFLRDRRGATAIEYALMASGIFLVIVTAVQLLGTGVADLYETIVEGVNDVANPPPAP